jgi:glycine/D-amino acid oxidase-like deaminating enzyme
MQKFQLPDIFGAITGPAGAVWPYRFVTNVFENLVAKYPKRLSIETNTPALEIATSDGSVYPYLIATPRGTINARHIVHATNGHVGHLVPRMRGKIFPLRGQMTVQASERCKSNLGADRSWLLSHGKGFDYMTRNVHTGDFFLGGGVLQGGNGGLDDVGNPADNKENFLSICHLSGVLSRIMRSANASGEDSGDEESPRLKASWSGVIALSCDMKPWVGKLPSGISRREVKFNESLSSGEWIAAGYTGSGMVYCWRSGEAIAAMIRGEELADWFPRCLLPTMKRFDSVGPEEIAAHFHAMAT